MILLIHCLPEDNIEELDVIDCVTVKLDLTIELKERKKDG